MAHAMGIQNIKQLPELKGGSTVRHAGLATFAHADST